MANTFLLKIVTPNHEVYDGKVEKVFLKNSNGKFEILANHANMITTTVPCIVEFKDEQGKMNKLFISTSIASVDSNGLTICSDAAEQKDEIDLQRAEKSKERAERRLKIPGKYNKKRAELALLRAIERINLKKTN